jgi:hypothetical protein
VCGHRGGGRVTGVQRRVCGHRLDGVTGGQGRVCGHRGDGVTGGQGRVCGHMVTE